MLVAALGLNILILVPVIRGMTRGHLDPSFGPDTVARQILICVYIAIAATSAALIRVHVLALQWAMPMTLALFGVQIACKVATVFAVGIRSPVVATNCVVVLVQCTVIAVWSGLSG